MSALDNLRFALQRVSGHRSDCSHLDQVRAVEPESRDSCPECVALGDEWRALRVCTTCGHVGCCDSSKNRHARRHAEASDHVVVRSLQPGESWLWCFTDRRLVKDPQNDHVEGQRSVQRFLGRRRGGGEALLRRDPGPRGL